MKVADELFSVEEQDPKESYRHYRNGKITRFYENGVEQVYRILTENGSVLATADHPWLTSHNRWRTTSQLKKGWYIRSVCEAIESSKESNEYKRGYVCGSIKGDGTMQGKYIRVAGDHEMVYQVAEYSTELGAPLPLRDFHSKQYPNLKVIVERRHQETFSTIESWMNGVSSEFKRGFIA